MWSWIGDELDEFELPCEFVGHGEIGTGNLSSCSRFWRTFVGSSVVMQWIEDGYRLLWVVKAPQSIEMRNAPSKLEHLEFVTNTVAEMVAEMAVTMLPPCEKPWVMSPMGVVPKKGTDKFRLSVNMRYVNGHVGKKAFKFEGPKDLSDLAERGDHAVSYDFMSG
jgi:hypothetical protein